MSKVSMTLITPVHIGSGKTIQGNAEYLHFSNAQEIAIVEERKILELIGADQLSIWIDYIENPASSFLEYLQKRKPTIQASDIAKRILSVKGNKRLYPANTLREQIHTGMGVPYIPGSSIKGALRTIFFADMMLSAHKEGIEDSRLKDRRYNKYKDQQLNKYAFGNDPNHDWFRLLQVSDFHFDTMTHADFSETLNEIGNDQVYEIKESVKQLIEYIPAEAVSLNGSIKLNDTLQKAAQQKGIFNGKGNSISIPELIAKVNTHTERLIDKELKFFANSDLPEEGETLLTELESIKNLFPLLATNECILRVGFGTGYHTMTGNWLDILTDDQYYDLSDAIRGKKYYSFPLPKSRKIISGGVPLGFIKIKFD